MTRSPIALLFLDFDGVLHRGTSGTFRQLPLLEDWLRSQPHVQVVVSSTWRWSHSLEELREIFAPDVAPRLIGVTPTKATRQSEIVAWLASAQLNAIPFAVLDDESGLFSPGWTPLVWVDGRFALTDAHLAELTIRLAV